MKRYVLLVLVPWLLSTLIACRGTLQVGVERTPTPRQESALGQLAYVQGGDIWVRDLRDSPGGAPRRLTSDGRNRAPRWSPSGRWLAFRKGESQVWIVSADGSAAHPLNDGAAVHVFAWAPLTDRLAYVVGGNELRAVNADGSDQADLVLSNPSATVGQIAWNPGGEWIAYEWQEQAPGQSPTYRGLLKVSSDGKMRTPVYLDYPGQPSEMQGLRLVGWTAGGCYLLFQDDMGSASLLADGAPLYAVPADGGTPVRLADAVLPYPDCVVPDATRPTRVAAIVGSYRGSWTNKALYLLSIPPGQDTAMTRPDVAASFPTWSPNSAQIAYVAMPDRGDLGGGEAARQGLMERRLFVVNVQNTPQHLQLTNDPTYRDERPLWSADGRHILFARLNSQDRASLWLIPAEGGKPTPVVEELTPAPEWAGPYGHIAWEDLLDWWTGLHLVTDCSALPPAVIPTSEGGLPVTEASPTATLTPESTPSATTVPPTMTLTAAGDLLITARGGAAQQVAIEFLRSVLARDVEKALTYWHLWQPDQPVNYGEFVRQMVGEWAKGEHRFAVGQTTYAGLVGPGDYQPLGEADPRAQDATVEVRIEGHPGALSLRKVDGRWLIVGLMTPGSHHAGSGLLILKEGVVHLVNEGGERPVGPMPEDAGHRVMGTRYLAYSSGNRVLALNLTDGTTHTLLEFSHRAAQDLELRWSTDGSTLAYAVAWDEADSSRMVELGTTDGYQQTTLDTQVARPAGPTPTPPSMPPILPAPGFANLDILGFDRSAGRLAVTQVGGEERYAAVWFYDSRTGKRVESLPVNVEAQEMSLSPRFTHLAVAISGTLQIWPLGTDAPPMVVDLPPDTHATWLSWSPDGQRLAYLLSEGAAPTLVASPTLSLWVWEAENGQARQLPLTPSPEAVLHGWTADGRAVVSRALEGIARREIVVLTDVATGQVRSFPLPEGSRVLGWIGDSGQ